MWNPRVGGEKPFLFYGGSSDSGSPPHGRGKAVKLILSGSTDRITPAWAGKSAVPAGYFSGKGDHPRMGGEKILAASKNNTERGSPPHGRGKVETMRSASMRIGITPAWAGKRFETVKTTITGWDHPRMGGEKIASWTVCNVSMGSPPHGRGKAPALQPWRLSPGITPAWAGKSIQSGGPLYPAWDHPRMGGEKERLARCAAWAEGSPPHGRGKDAGIPILAPVMGITPAWAGKRVPILWVIQLQGDHPRMGGEKRCPFTPQRPFMGSPPHGRGKGPRPENTPVLTRITPAWAGKSGGNGGCGTPR